jgi:hypothetical protein
MPVKIDAPGARACQATEFGDASDYGVMGAEHFRIAGGADLAPLLQGLDGDLCQAPHWGYLISGEVVAHTRTVGRRRFRRATSSTGRPGTPCA